MKISLIQKIITLLFLCIIIAGCEKTHQLLLNIGAPENRVPGFWTLESEYKDGSLIYNYAGATAFGDYIDAIIYGNGEIDIRSKNLNPNGLECTRGIWQLINRKKNIEIILTDSCYFAPPYNTAISPVIFDWEILKLQDQEMKVKEIRKDGIYEFNFKIGKTRNP